MKTIDLLFIDPNIENYSRLNDDYLSDIEFNCFQSVLPDKEYELFTNIMSKPLIDPAKIYERQNIFKDLIKYQTFAEKLISICDMAQKNRMPKYDLVSRSIPPKEKLIEYLKVFSKTLEFPNKLLAAVRDKVFVSESLSKLRYQLDIEQEINEIEDLITNLVNNILEDNISLQIEFGKTFKLQYATIYSTGSKDITSSKRKLFKNKQITDGIPYGYDFIADLQVGLMLESGVKNLSNILYQINSHILSYCNSLSMQLSFYISGMKIIKYLESTGVNIYFPSLTSEENKLNTEGLLDVGLIIKRGASKDVIPNDFNSENNSFYLISGVNQGGKTTFLKSVGMAQLFSQNGLPVAAANYTSSIFHNFISHFPKGEDDQLNSGKLEEELLRFKRDLPLMVKNSLILMNESFATTTEREGSEISIDSLRALSFTKPMLFFVTHNYVLLKNKNEYSSTFQNGISLRSLITIKGSTPEERTYKLIEGEPQEEINTIEFLKERFLNTN